MELIIKNINNPADKNLIVTLAKRLGLVAEESEESKTNKRQAGELKGMLISMSDDFDAPLDELQDYM
ncbi:MAG: DUF2281 domain-containing protein [Opitutaceae bacterium]|nr:DUF2281 domain-containing protein [Cytophagales bacterium]